MNYSDDEIDKYCPEFPIVQLQTDPIFLKDALNIQSILKSNLWYSNASSRQRTIMENRVRLLSEKTEFLGYNMLKGHNVLHASIGGSFFYKMDQIINDLDVNIIVAGACFEYAKLNTSDIFLDSTRLPMYTSLMIFGEENLTRRIKTNDAIEIGEYKHTGLTFREGCVMPWRNATFYGRNFLFPFAINKQNIFVRIKRQIYYSELVLNNKITRYSSKDIQINKAYNRLAEAYFFLANGFPESNLSVSEAFTLFYKKHRTENDVKKMLSDIKLCINTLIITENRPTLS